MTAEMIDDASRVTAETTGGASRVTGDARRAKTYRRRRRLGLRVERIVVSEQAIEGLAKRGYLEHAAIADRETVKTAIESFIVDQLE